MSLLPATPDLQNSFHSACFDDGWAKESYGLPEEMHDFGCGARQCPANYTCEVQRSAAQRGAALGPSLCAWCHVRRMRGMGLVV